MCDIVNKRGSFKNVHFDAEEFIRPVLLLLLFLNFQSGLGEYFLVQFPAPADTEILLIDQKAFLAMVLLHHDDPFLMQGKLGLLEEAYCVFISQVG